MNSEFSHLLASRERPLINLSEIAVNLNFKFSLGFYCVLFSPG